MKFDISKELIFYKISTYKSVFITPEWHATDTIQHAHLLTSKLASNHLKLNWNKSIKWSVGGKRYSHTHTHTHTHTHVRLEKAGFPKLSPHLPRKLSDWDVH